jgi:endonuclease III
MRPTKSPAATKSTKTTKAAKAATLPQSTATLASDAATRARASAIVAQLRQDYPDAKCSLDYSNVFELLVATILSAQCTDERVNKVTPVLFRKYPRIVDYANADLKELEQDVHSTGFFRNKAKNIQAAAQTVLEKFQGQVPQTMAELLTLPGVARKTANVVLGNGFGIAVGVVVDTHVRRISNRLGFTASADPERIERDLMPVLPAADWLDFSHLLIYHGRQICKPKPRCQNCNLQTLCPSAGKVAD